jgi:hypothetical protein
MGQLVLTATTIDGYAFHNVEPPGDTWHNIVIGAGTSHHDSGQTTTNLLWCSTTTNKYRANYRPIFCYDTSALAGKTVTAVTWQIMGTSKSDPGTWAPNICVYSVIPASTVELSNGDYATFGHDELANIITYAGWVAEAWNTFTFNSTGIAYISTSGVTSLGLRNANYDVADELDPNNHDFTWASNRDSWLSMYKAAELGKEPILTIDYSDAPTPGVSGSGTYFARREQWRGSGF